MSRSGSLSKNIGRQETHCQPSALLETRELKGILCVFGITENEKQYDVDCEEKSSWEKMHIDTRSENEGKRQYREEAEGKWFWRASRENRK